jgi:hypothetical protein
MVTAPGLNLLESHDIGFFAKSLPESITVALSNESPGIHTVV